jgi:heat shock protein HslJ
MCSSRSPLRRACPPPLHIKKAFDLKWYKVTRRAPKGQGTWVYAPPSPRPSPPLGRGERVQGVGGCNTISCEMHS